MFISIFLPFISNSVCMSYTKKMICLYSSLALLLFANILLIG